MKKISIIIPTYNSERTLSKTLLSITSQKKISKRDVEICVVDGGSSDNTKIIAKKFGALIINNYKVQQEYAKYIGLVYSRSKYLLFLDSDEYLNNEYSLANRISILEKQKKIHAIFSSGYRSVGNSLTNSYIATFGDPFAYFMYGISPNYQYYINDCISKYKVIFNDSKAVGFQIKDNDTLPLFDLCAGILINREYVIKHLDVTNNILTIPKLPGMIIKNDGAFFVAKGEYIVHDSAEKINRFINKLKWRAIANIHYKHIPGTGHANRDILQPKNFNIKKYFYIPYVVTLIGPLVTSLYYLLFRRKIAAILHFPLSVIVSYFIVSNLILCFVGLQPKLHIYGKENYYESL